MAAEQLKAGSHHEGIGLSEKISRTPRCKLDGGNHGAAGGNDRSALGRTGDIGICADKLCAVHDKTDGL